MARKDAAFEAYRALYNAGLVNENLLPAKDEGEESAIQYGRQNDQPSIVSVSCTIDPWEVLVQDHHRYPHEWYQTLLQVNAHGEDPFQIILLTPCAVPAMPDVLLHWNEKKCYNVKTSSLRSIMLTDTDIRLLQVITWNMLRSVFGIYIEDNAYDFIYFLAPCRTQDFAISVPELQEWHRVTRGQRTARELVLQGSVDPKYWGVATQQEDMRRYIVKAIRQASSVASFDIETVFLEAIRFPKRRDFLHSIPETERRNEAYTKAEPLTVSSCTVDNLPISHTMLALFFPSIAHKLEEYMVADLLRTSLLKHIDIDASHLPLLVRALTSSAADSESNYQRLEFLGDCNL